MSNLKDAVSISAYHNMPDEYIERNALRSIQRKMGELPAGSENSSKFAADLMGVADAAKAVLQEHCGLSETDSAACEQVQTLVATTVAQACVEAIVITMQVANRLGIDLAQSIQEEADGHTSM